MANKEKNLRELAGRIYNLDEEVYKELGSSLGRVFNGEREHCIEETVRMMNERNQAHILRNELALISNMARTIPDPNCRKRIMSKYNKILREVEDLPTSFIKGDILDQKMAQLNSLHLSNRFAKSDHLIICIGRTYGCGGSEIGFTLADKLKINYYDVEIFDEVLKRLEAERTSVRDRGGYPYQKGGKDNRQYLNEVPAFTPAPRSTLKEKLREFNRYHGLPKKDAVFFNQSDLLCDMAKSEGFVVMGRCADAILTNNRIPHISIFITAPLEKRIERVMEVRGVENEKKARHLLTKLDKEHVKYYKYYTGRRWGKAGNYDLCINSASYGIQGSVDLILRMIKREE
ncbi:MAG: cytidylate kinase-like family protein [Hespellia sp.]|nr:cytidylate kinase-like family protein [Hespellia sp.]